MPLCRMKAELVEQYHKAVRRYAEAVTQLNRSIKNGEPLKFNQLADIVDEARLTVEECRQKLSAHLAEHKC